MRASPRPTRCSSPCRTSSASTTTPTSSRRSSSMSRLAWGGGKARRGPPLQTQIFYNGAYADLLESSSTSRLTHCHRSSCPSWYRSWNTGIKSTVTPGPRRTVGDRLASNNPGHPRESPARPRGALGSPRMLLASGVHISTNGHRVLGLESPIAVPVWKDRCLATWKIRETQKSLQRKSCGYQHPRGQCCNSRLDKTQSSV